MFYRTPTWTILGSLTKLFQPLMFGEGGAPAEPPAEPPVTPPATPPATPPVSNWRDSLPDDIKGHATLANFKSVEELAKSHLEAQKLIGRKGIIPPVEGASEEEISKFHNELGRPETVEGYKLENIKLPEGVTVDENVKSEFLKAGHKEGFTNKQMNFLLKWQIENMGNATKAEGDARDTEIAEAETKLRTEMGNAYDANLALANKVVGKYADDSAKEFLSKSLGHDPRMVRMMIKIGKDMGEDTLGEGSAIMTKTPDEAQKEISLIRNNPKHPYHIQGHPEHQAALKQMRDLYEMGYPDKKPE